MARSLILESALRYLVRSLVRTVPSDQLARDLHLTDDEVAAMLRAEPRRHGRQAAHELADVLYCEDCGTRSRPDDIRAELTCPECGSTNTTWIAVERGEDD